MINQNIFFKTYKKNWYLNNFKDGSIYFIHPYIKKIYTQSLNCTFENNTDSLFIEPSKQEYYEKKYDFLKKHHVISNDIIQSKKTIQITPKEITKNLANIRQVTFEVTDACNLKCKYCAYGELYSNYDKRSKKFINSSTAIDLLNHLNKFWNSNYNIGHNKDIFISFYGGEPLLNIEFIKRTVEHANRLKLKHNHFTFSMTTNGILLDKHIDYLIENNFHLLISLDGNFHDNQYRTFYNGKPSFYRLEKNITYIQSVYPEFFKNNIEFNSVIHNKNSVGSIYSYFKSKFNKYPSLGALSLNGVNDQKRERFNKTYRNINESLKESENPQKISDEMFIKIPQNSEISLFTHQHSLSTFVNYNDLFDKNKEIEYLTNGTCSPFSKKIFVTVNGYLLACEKIGHQFKLGVVRNGRVIISAKKIADMYNINFKKLADQCSYCYKNSFCNQCIFLIDQITNTPKCKSFLNLESYQRFLSNKISYLESNPQYYQLIKENIYADI